MIPVFYAVDTADRASAAAMLTVLGDLVEVKFGLEFLFANGVSACHDLAQVGATRKRLVFIDAKPHDIPRTVAGAIRSIITVAEPDFISLHTCDGIAPLYAAVQAANERAQCGYQRPKLLGVTVLTSISDVRQMALLHERADHAVQAGLDGLICSAHEAKDFAAMDANLYLMVPGIRQGASLDDQHRVATARQALDNGASAVVIGSDLSTAANPRQMIETILESMR